MPNKNYISGRNHEYKVMKDYRTMGYECIRSSGSHGFYDVLAINILKKEIKLIQCKPKSISKNKRQEILASNNGIDGHYYVEFLVE